MSSARKARVKSDERGSIFSASDLPLSNVDEQEGGATSG